MTKRKRNQKVQNEKFLSALEATIKITAEGPVKKEGLFWVEELKKEVNADQLLVFAYDRYESISFIEKTLGAFFDRVCIRAFGHRGLTA